MSRILLRSSANGGQINLSYANQTSQSTAYQAAKRGLDILAVILLSPIALLVILLLAILVRRDAGPAFYSQKRLGKGGVVFDMWKLRTMVSNAEAKLEEHLRNNLDARLEWDRTQKLANDPRITGIGKYLRKFSLDELPQLWNVFMGQMSLVGPRPMFPEQRQHYPGTAYFDLRPGIHRRLAGERQKRMFIRGARQIRYRLCTAYVLR